jgi:hypothetical protein
MSPSDFNFFMPLSAAEVCFFKITFFFFRSVFAHRTIFTSPYGLASSHCVLPRYELGNEAGGPHRLPSSIDPRYTH